VRFLLDSNAVIALLKGHRGFRARIGQHDPGDFAISAVVAHELYFGAYRSARAAENLARLDGLRLAVLDFDKEDARRAGELRAALAAAGLPIGPYDVLIAGQALARGLTLITRNMREFQRVALLQAEDWETQV
jgi:tRNA(fMet)-specific endonuclease VapC